MIKSIILAAVLVWSTASFAGNGFSLGVDGGFSSFNSNSVTQSAFGVGARVGYQFDTSWEVSGDWLYASTTPSGAPAGFSSNANIFLVNLDYRFTGSISGLFVGPKVGLANISSGGYTGQSFAAGGEVGYDYYFGQISVGPRLEYEYIAGPTLNGVSTSSAGLFNALASVKYWF